jgi:hypothetical protein
VAYNLPPDWLLGMPSGHMLIPLSEKDELVPNSVGMVILNAVREMVRHVDDVNRCS